MMTVLALDERDGVRVAGRAAAVLSVASVVVHLVHAQSTPPTGWLMVVMALTCLPCAWHLARRPGARVWRLTALADVTMLLLHLQMSADMAEMHHGGEHVQHLAVPVWLVPALLCSQLGLAAFGWARTRSEVSSS